MRLTGVVNEVAADEVTPELVRGVHDDEAASRRVYDKITRPSNGPMSFLMRPIGLMWA